MEEKRDVVAGEGRRLTRDEANRVFMGSHLLSRRIRGVQYVPSDDEEATRWFSDEHPLMVPAVIRENFSGSRVTSRGKVGVCNPQDQAVTDYLNTPEALLRATNTENQARHNLVDAVMVAGVLVHYARKARKFLKKS